MSTASRLEGVITRPFGAVGDNVSRARRVGRPGRGSQCGIPLAFFGRPQPERLHSLSCPWLDVFECSGIKSLKIILLHVL
jgi:hypothetical protein